MDLSYALSQVRQNWSSRTWWRNRVLTPYVLGTATRLDPRNPGYDGAVRVMDEDWDNLFILDACRADYFERVVDLDSFDAYRREISLGSHSSEWTERNFAGREFGDTVYLSANPHTGLLAGESFHELVELTEEDFDDEARTALPGTMVERAVELHERNPHKRLIVHFMQPHGPFVYEGADLGTSAPDDDAAYWEGYSRTLDYVLPFVRELAERVGGRSVVSADHGQTHDATLYGLIDIDAHPPGLRLPELVEVPWATIEGDERREVRAGDVTRFEESSTEDVEKRLEHLGYR